MEERVLIIINEKAIEAEDRLNYELETNKWSIKNIFPLKAYDDKYISMIVVLYRELKIIKEDHPFEEVSKYLGGSVINQNEINALLKALKEVE